MALDSGSPCRNDGVLAKMRIAELARRLRLLGFDSLYENTYQDAEIADIAESEKRAVLTRDRRLLHAKRITHGYWVRSVHADRQTEEVLRRFDLYRQINPFCRCLRCNGLLHPVAKADVLPKLEPKTRLYYEKFFICECCHQIYWEGSHVGNMREMCDKYRILGGYDKE